MASLAVGGCVIHRDGRDVVGLDSDTFGDGLVGRTVISTVVEAPDEETGYERARPLFEESRALLARLSSELPWLARRPLVWIHDSQRRSHTTG
jgi:hypothetical protein